MSAKRALMLTIDDENSFTKQQERRYKETNVNINPTELELDAVFETPLAARDDEGCCFQGKTKNKN
jgi:hypothetical protein